MLFLDCVSSFIDDPIVPLKVEEEEEDKVVIGVGISLVMWASGGAFGLFY